MPSNKSILQLASELATGGITSSALIKSRLSLASRYNGFAILDECGDLALQAAERKDEERNEKMRRNDKVPILSGIPISIKDNFNMKGSRTTAGSRMLENFKSLYNATVVDRLSQAGAIPCLKANMDEFGMGSSMLNSSFGRCPNPWSPPGGPLLSPGGSSGASAAAVALGLVPAAIGSDTGGSVRQPASFCGVVGLKPTYGSVSRYGLISYASSMDTPGIITNSVLDAAIVYDAIRGHDANDPTSIRFSSQGENNGHFIRSLLTTQRNHPSSQTSTSSNISSSPTSIDFGDPIKLLTLSREHLSLSGITIGVPDEFLLEELDRDVFTAWQQALDVLSDAGAAIKKISLPTLKQALPCYYVLACAEASSNLSRYDGIRYGNHSVGTSEQSTATIHGSGDKSLQAMISRTRGIGFGPEVLKRILAGTFILSESAYHEYYGKAELIRQKIKAEVSAAFREGGVNIIAGPTSPMLPFELDNPPPPADMILGDLFTVPINLFGGPAISVPIAVSNVPATIKSPSTVKPIGIQLMGPFLGELSLLRTALTLEQRVNFKDLIPDWVYARTDTHLRNDL